MRKPFSHDRRAALAAALATLLVAFAPDASADAGRPKRVVAGADDVASGILRLPDPASQQTHSRSAWIPVEFNGEGLAAIEFPVNRAGPLALAALTSGLSWKIDARVGAAPWRNLEALAREGGIARSVQALEGPMGGASIERFDFELAPAGDWTLRISAPPGSPNGWIVAADASPLRLAAHLTSYELFSDGSAGVSAFLHDATRPGTQSLNLAVERAVLHIDTDGAKLQLPLAQRGDLFTAQLPAGIVGDVRARVEIAGYDGQLRPFLRSVNLAFPIIERSVQFDGRIEESVTQTGRLRVRVGVARESANAPATRLHASAEVWGHDSEGDWAPIGWLSSIRPLEQSGQRFVEFEIDAEQLQAANASAPLELRRLRIQDPDTHIPFDRVARVPLAGQPHASATGNLTPTSTGLAQAAPQPRSLLLVHGYCSGGVWPESDFTPPFQTFLDVDQNRSHDEFAQLIAAEGDGLVSFGVVAHSQGGPAALHLLTYYESGLDHAVGARRIQSVGSPYLGTPLAPLGDIIPGVGCGANFDLGPDGSALWLAGIPSAQRGEVHFYTTSETTFFDCNPVSGLILSNPEDGVVEMAAGQLPGAVSEGHALGWCHTTGMTQPAQYTDTSRNQVMDAAAAR